ncbi:MAG: hypothetical protein KBT45_07985 [Bacteroidales bacterium]|nr:hypothetical protein [Candidatus Colimorpha pelethequi]
MKNTILHFLEAIPPKPTPFPPQILPENGRIPISFFQPSVLLPRLSKPIRQVHMPNDAVEDM